MLIKLNKRLQGTQAEDHPKKGHKDYIIGLYAIVVGNRRLPWMQVTSVPKEVISDVKENRDYTQRAYLAKIKNWFETDMRPTLEILKLKDSQDEERKREDLAEQVEETKKH